MIYHIIILFIAYIYIYIYIYQWYSSIVVSNKFPFGKQDFLYFIGYKEGKKIRTWCILIPILIPKYKIYFEKTKTKYTYFMIEEEKLLDKYIENL